jgi:hypothetical protein
MEMLSASVLISSLLEPLKQWKVLGFGEHYHDKVSDYDALVIHTPSIFSETDKDIHAQLKRGVVDEFVTHISRGVEYTHVVSKRVRQIQSPNRRYQAARHDWTAILDERRDLELLSQSSTAPGYRQAGKSSL